MTSAPRVVSASGAPTRSATQPAWILDGVGGGRTIPLVIVGVLVLVVGLVLVAAPLAAGRAANAVRFVPYSTEPRRVAQYRVAGAAIAAAGVVIALVLR